MICACILTAIIFASHSAFRHSNNFVSVTCEPIIQTVKAPSGSSTVYGIYRVRNRGNDELRLGEPSLSCGCTSASIVPPIIKPGEEGVIKLEGRAPDFGRRSVSVVVSTGRFDVPSLNLEFVMISSAVPPYLVSNSGPINFGRLRSAPQSSRLEIFTHERSRSQPWLATVVCDLPGIEIHGDLEQEMVSEPGVTLRRYGYTVTLTKLPPPGPFRGYLTLHGAGTVDGASPVAEIPVLGSVPTALTVSPSHLYLHADSAGVCGRIAFMVLHDQVKPIEIEPDPQVIANFECRLEHVTGATRVELNPKHPFKEDTSTTLKFKTNVSQFEGIGVPLLIRRDP